MQVREHRKGGASSNLFLAVLMLWGFCFLSCNSDSKSTASAEGGDKALEKLTDLIEKAPNDHSLLYERAKYQYEQKQYDPVINDMNAAIALDSLVPEYYHLLSNAYMDYYRSRDALNTMIDAADRFPERIPTLLKLSETQLILKQNEESLFTVARILTVDPDHAEGHFMKGMNFRAMGDADRAIASFQTVTELDPEIIDAWLLIGDLFEEKGMPVAKEFFEAATRVEPDNPNVWHSLAFYLQNNGDDEGAVKVYRKINLIDKNYTDAYLNSGIVLLSNKKLAEAKEQFEILAKIQPENHFAYYYRGLIHEQEGNFAAAKSDYQTSLNLKSDYRDAQKALDNIAAAEAKAAEAKG